MKIIELVFCPKCKATGKTPHPRLPFRVTLCDKCGGRGRLVKLPHRAKLGRVRKIRTA